MNKKIISLAILVLLFGLIAFSVKAVGDTKIENPLGYNDMPSLLTGVAGAFGTLIAGLGTIMIVVAAILYLLSAGSPEKMKTAKTALIYAIVGIGVGISAKIIADLVVDLLKKT